MSPLLNCPFCGSTATPREQPLGRCDAVEGAVECDNIDCSAQIDADTLEEAVSAWNRRTPPEQSAAGHPVAVDGGKQAASAASELKDARAAINRSGEP